jgi:acetoin utilization protein AcuB
MHMAKDMTTIPAVPVRQYPIVREHMTPGPHTIGRTQSLAAASRMMRDNEIRHLPVLDGGKVIGVVSERDLLLIDSLPGVEPADVRVEEAMVQDVFSVSPDTPVGEAIETMIDRKLGSAIVCDGERVLGVFTTVDALRALHSLLERK